MAEFRAHCREAPSLAALPVELVAPTHDGGVQQPDNGEQERRGALCGQRPRAPFSIVSFIYFAPFSASL